MDDDRIKKMAVSSNYMGGVEKWARHREFGGIHLHPSTGEVVHEKAMVQELHAPESDLNIPDLSIDLDDDGMDIIPGSLVSENPDPKGRLEPDTDLDFRPTPDHEAGNIGEESQGFRSNIQDIIDGLNLKKGDDPK